MYDLLIKNGLVADGSGAPLFRADVAVRDGRIAKVAPSIKEGAIETLDADGLTVSPGFIDSHSHDDRTILLGTDSANILLQGITTEITGNCGGSIVPYLPEFFGIGGVGDGQQEKAEGLIRRGGDLPALIAELAEKGMPLNAAFLIGHRNLRVRAMGWEDRKPTAPEMEEMKALLRHEMESGALGLSSGLIYPPGSYAGPEELVGLAASITDYPGAIYCTHMRDEGYYEVDAVREALDLGKEAGIHVHISHHQITGKGNEGLSKITLGMMDDAIAEGQRVTLDAYPYDACATALINCIPPKYRAVGNEAFLEQLKGPDLRARIRADLEVVPTYFDNILGTTGFDKTMTQDSDGSLITLEDLAKKRGLDPYDAFFDLLIETKGTARGIYRMIYAEDMHRILKHPCASLGTDCASMSPAPFNHPRFSAAFPHFLTEFCRDNPWLPLETGIRKATGLAADTFGLTRKGYIKEGLDADLVIFDYAKLEGPASYGHGDLPNEGIKAVYVNGVRAVRDGAVTGKRAGRCVLRDEVLG